MSAASDAPRETPRATVVLSPAALRKIEARLRTRYHAYLRPGERIALAIEEEPDFVYAKLTLFRRDKTFSLDLEGAVIVQDQDASFLSATLPHDRLLAAIEYLAEQLAGYFRAQRQQRFHLDWRKHPFDAMLIRFRGEERSPGLEQQANQLLGEGVEDA
ncbi:hypothetical protein DL240_05435 [Lujinxingia litoralis]|uniref:Uncharacterized protein n=1 Tax=Lujinxingia litoralis TaxID=2211119 RepID=A0A328C6Y7_9DELT|nr:hypothetical protein [Lujinxingia litoralis]RAL23603.1 hypothetical protein DL240_05435 [Lujinxingia litoralis]